MTDKERIEIRKLRAQGIMPTEISKITGIKLETIKSYFKRHKNMMERKIKSFVVINAGINIGIHI